MLSFKDLQEVLQPKAAGEKRFKDKHVADTIDYPLNDAEINKGTKKSPAKKKRIADSEEGKDAAVYEENEEMTPDQEKKREEIVMAMKKDKEKLQARYGESWKAVMYATATKQAMSESFELDEAQKMFMFKTKAEAEKKAKEIKGVMTELGPKNFMVVTKDLTKVPSKAKMKFGKDKDVTPKGYGPDEELDESAAGIAQLKKAYEPMRGKKISLDNAKKLSAIMDKFADDKAMLMKLVKADIPFVTQSAVTKLITKHNMKGAEINKMMKEGNEFVMALKAAKEKGEKTFVVAGKTYQIKEGIEGGKSLKIDARYKTFREKLLKLGYQKADIDEKAPKMKTTDIMRDRGKKAGPQTYQVDIEGAGRATVKAANEKMAIQKAMTQMKINKKIKPLPKATVSVAEEVELDEAKYELYHKDFSGAMQHAYHVAKKHHGITIDPEEIDNKVATGPRKPSEGKTNTYRLKGDKGAVQIQVYNKGGSKPFELNMYKEEVDLDEAVKITHVLIDTADGNKVKAMASSEKGVMQSKNSAERPPMSVKDKNTLKVVQLKKPVSQKASEKMVGYPLNEEVDLDEAFKINPVNVKLNDGSMVKISKDDASALNGLYNSLNPGNAKTMIKKMMQDKKSYGEILAFAKQAM